MEKRNSDRHATDQSIACTLFNSHSSNNTIDGKITNYCDFGMFAILPTYIRAGTVLLIKTTNRPNNRLPAKIEEGFRSISLMEVKWSKPLSADGDSCFGTGLRHLAIW
jgi:hypothetical protein